jgi:hypothetical protein
LVAVVTIVAVVAGCSDKSSPEASTSAPSSVPPAVVPSLETAVSPPAAPASPAAALEADFDQQFAGLNVGVAFTAVGDPAAAPISLGAWKEGPAWSTSKVPVSIAALVGPPPSDVTDNMRGAIIRSDNASAEAVWASLGTPEVAKQKVEAVLRAAGDPTSVQSQKVRAEFSAFGQTIWSLTNQAHFLSVAACDPADAPIFTLMGEVESDQRWGLGVFDEWQIKGGWGPSLSGAYLVRQIGVVTTPKGKTAVAIAAEPSSGSFGEGTQTLTKLANWLKAHQAELPTGQCSGGGSSPMNTPIASSPPVETPTVNTAPASPAPLASATPNPPPVPSATPNPSPVSESP